MVRLPLVALLAALAAPPAGTAGPGISTGPDGRRVDRPAAPPLVVTLTVDGIITSNTEAYVKAGLERAADRSAAAVLLTLDTPGGELDSTRALVRDMLASPVPVLVWVGPAGAHAGSAGVFVTLAADVAAMHPTSNIGAAHPVLATGQDVEQVAGKDMARKVENDTAAFARSVAEARGRNVAWAEKAVRDSVAITAQEAVKERVVDYVAPTAAAAIEQADGRTVRAGASPVTLHLRGAVQEPFEPSIRQRVLMFISSPLVVVLLVLVGLLGLGIEFYHPGALLPGIAGGLCLFLVFVAAQLIPRNLAAVLLLVAGAALLVSEAYFTSHGVAGAAGAVCLVVGMSFLIDRSAPGQLFDPGALSVSPWVIWPTPIALAALFGFMGWKVARGRRIPLQLGGPGMVGAPGEALTEIGPEGGEAFLHGEYWRARSAAPIARGARVRVVAVEGLVVTVEEDGGLR